MAHVLSVSSSDPLVERRSPLVELLFLAGPTIAQMASYTLMQFFDTWMLAHVGTRVTEPTAGSNGGMLAFSVISLGMGTLWVVNTLVSQSFGRKDFVSCGRYLWQGVWFALAFSVLLLPGLPFVSLLFKCRWVAHEPELVRLETIYLQIVLGGSAMKLIGTACSQFLLAVDRPNSVLIATAIGISANVVAAWALIFGHLGSPQLGVAGSAWGQNIGVFVEMGCLIFFVTLPAVRKMYNIRDWRPRSGMLWTLMRIGIPSGGLVVSEVLAWSTFTIVVMGVFGTKVMTANAFIFRFMSVSFMPAFGIGTAITALVGRYIGMGRPDIARQRAHLGFAMTAVYMMICGVFFFLGRSVLMHMFTDDPEVLRVGAMLLVFAAVYQFFDAVYIVYNGALRGAGDTFIPAIATAVLCWGMIVVGGYAIASFRTEWGAAGPWTLATVYGITLGLFILIRFRRGKWKAIKSGAEALEPGGFEVIPSIANNI